VIELNLALPPLHFDSHALFKGRYAGSHVRHSVHDHKAGRALPYGAKKAARPLHLGRLAVYLNPIGMKGHGYRFSLEPLHLLALEGKPDQPAMAKLQYRVFPDQFQACHLLP